MPREPSGSSPARRRAWSLALPAVLSAVCSGPSLAGHDGPVVEDRCSGSAVTVVVPRDEAGDVAEVCRAVKLALDFFSSARLPGPGTTVVRLLDETTREHLETDELGRYDGKAGVVLVPTYASALRRSADAEPGLARIRTRAAWRGFIVHELAHAAVHTGCAATCPSRAIHEYIAAVAQIGSLPESERDALLEAYRSVDPFAAPAEISEIYYALSPLQFAVKAYKHYRQLPDAPEFLRSALAAR